MEIFIILLLILLNGIFAMAEMAIISARKHKLKHLANKGDKDAQIALDLSNNPNKLLSTAQIGITLIGILAGAFGGATLAADLSKKLNSEFLGVGIVVLVIAYLSLVIGELVPKRIALSDPEGVALFVARFMNILASLTGPLVRLLSISNDLVLKILRIKPKKQALVSEDEVRMLISEGAKIGIFDPEEKNIVERTLNLDDKKLTALMTPREKIAYFDIDDSYLEIKEKLAKNPHSHYPVCKGSLNKIVGIVRTEGLLTRFLGNESIDLKKALHRSIFVPASMNGLQVLELLKKTGIHICLVTDKKKVIGLISLTDILEAIVGDYDEG